MINDGNKPLYPFLTPCNQFLVHTVISRIWLDRFVYLDEQKHKSDIRGKQTEAEKILI